MPKQGRRHNTMTDKVLIALCNHKQANPSLSQAYWQCWLKLDYNIEVSQPTISQTLQRSVELLKQHQDLNVRSKRHRTVKYQHLEEVLTEWIFTNEECISITGYLIKENATKILDIMYPGHEPFEFSNGWLDGFKLCHQMKCIRQFGESGLVDMEAVSVALPGIPQLLDKYAWKDIYNMDETGLFYRMQADNSLAKKQLERLKQSKERLTMVLCCNGDGSNKLPLWVIGKYNNLRCFKHINRASIGCEYRSNSSAWMTQIIFLERLQALDLHVANQKVLLILDKCSAHIPIHELVARIQLRNTTVFYLPPNMTSKIQLCDVGIIRNFKAYYRHRFNSLLLQRLDAGVEQVVKIDVLEAIRLAIPAWSTDVKIETIHNCFKHCQIHTPTVPEQQPTTVDLIDKDVIDELQSQIRSFRYRNPMDIINLLNYLNEDIISYTPTLREIIDVHFPQQDDTKAGDDNIEEVDVTRGLMDPRRLTS